MPKTPDTTLSDQQLPISAIKTELERVLDDFILYTLEQAQIDTESINSVQGIFHQQVISLVEKKLLYHCLEACQYSRTKTAKLLGINRHTLRKRLDNYQIGIKYNSVAYGKQKNRKKRGDSKPLDKDSPRAML